MKKKILKWLSLSLILSCIFSISSFAASSRPHITHIPPANTQLLPPEQTYSEDTKQMLQRGSLLSTCFLRISNSGGGEIGILADTMVHSKVENMYVTIYLDRYDDAEKNWTNVERYDYEFLGTDMPDGQVDSQLIGFHETNQPSGYYYRLWAYHEVEKDGDWEVMRTETKGVMITEIP